MRAKTRYVKCTLQDGRLLILTLKEFQEAWERAQAYQKAQRRKQQGKEKACCS